MATNVTRLRWRPQVDLGTRLRLVRKEHGRLLGKPKLTQEAFAEILDVNVNTYKQWESDRAKPEDVITFARHVYDVTGADPAWLLSVEDDGPEGGLTQGVSVSRCTAPSPGGTVLRFPALQELAA